VSLSGIIKERASAGDNTLQFFEAWELTLPQLLKDRARRYKDRVLFYFEDVRRRKADLPGV